MIHRYYQEMDMAVLFSVDFQYHFSQNLQAVIEPSNIKVRNDSTQIVGSSVEIEASFLELALKTHINNRKL